MSHIHIKRISKDRLIVEKFQYSTRKWLIHKRSGEVYFGNLF